MNRYFRPQGRQMIGNHPTNAPLGREQTPEDMGRAVVFFASDDARNVTGQALNVDGGYILR